MKYFRAMHRKSFYQIAFQFFLLAIILSLLTGTSFGATSRKKKKRSRTQGATVTQVSATRRVHHRRSHYGPWTEPTYADSTVGDNVDGEDLTVRRAAVEALGAYNGSVVVVDPGSGRILSMVNQRIALGSGFQPCSTIKVSVALAGLSEKAIDPDSKMRVGGMKMDLTYALAHSNNLYFASLGERLGFEKVSYYAHLFGYGEKAGLNIPGEQPGHYPDAP